MEHTGVYRFAQVRVEIVSVHEEVHRRCAAYAAEGPADFRVRTELKDILAEERRSGEIRLTESRLESMAVYRKIAERMPEFGAFLFHCSALAAEGKGFLFAAPSGTGKSTHARLWRELPGSGVAMINDDKPLIRADGNGGAWVYGTPWDGKHHLSTNMGVPMQAVCLLERGEKNRIRRISGKEAMPGLLGQCYRPENPEMLRKTLEMLTGIRVEFYRLQCRPDREAAELARSVLLGEAPSGLPGKTCVHAGKGI